MVTSDESRSVRTHQDFQYIPYKYYYTLSIPIKHALQIHTHTHKKKTSFTTVSRTMST